MKREEYAEFFAVKALTRPHIVFPENSSWNTAFDADYESEVSFFYSMKYRGTNEGVELLKSTNIY